MEKGAKTEGINGMSRYIYCRKCYQKQTAKLKKGAEGLTVVFSGLAADDFVCDYCNALIVEGDSCYAITFVDRPSDYQTWEKGYLTGLDRVI